MEFNVKPGMSFTATQVVVYEDTAAKYGSGLIEVYATPAMIALMENAALKTVYSHLPEGYNTVGFEINVRHLKPTPIGMKVECTATLKEVDNKKLIFQVVAHDEEGKIGEGTHIRYIINTQKFLEKYTFKK